MKHFILLFGLAVCLISCKDDEGDVCKECYAYTFDAFNQEYTNINDTIGTYCNEDLNVLHNSTNYEAVNAIVNFEIGLDAHYEYALSNGHVVIKCPN